MDRIITPSLTSVKCGKSYSLSDQRQRSIASSTSPRETVEFRDISGSNWTVKLPIIDKRINCLSGENNASRNLVEIITESRRWLALKRKKSQRAFCGPEHNGTQLGII